MEAHLEQAEYAVVALMNISNTLAAGTSIDDTPRSSTRRRS